MSDFEWDPDSFLATMLAEIPGYDELQEAMALVARGRNVLEFGIGTGETSFASWRGTPARAGPDRRQCSDAGTCTRAIT